MNPDKTNEQKFVSGLNLSEDIDIAMMELALTYEHYSHKKITAKSPPSGNMPIKAFHLIQSFAPGECDVEKAHEIGLEWVRKAFGDDFQAMVCTHTDHEHIHNHILLCPYSLSGKKFNSNKTTLQAIRDVSDGICRERGIGIMEQLLSQPDYEPSGVSYGEWKHKKMGTSWKERIRVRIDLLIPSVNSFDELLAILERQGYTIRRGKYISIKAPNQNRAVRLKTLGVRYEESHLVCRIEKLVRNRSKPKPLDEIIDDVMKEYSYQTRKYSFAKSVQNDIYSLSHQLNIINGENINSIGEVEGKLHRVRKQITDIENIIRNGEISSWQIENYSNTLEELKSKERDYQSIIDTYNESSSGDYISRLVKAAQDKMSEQEKIKLRYLKEMQYEVYLPNDDNYLPISKWKECPTTDKYTKVYTGSWYDTDGESLAERLENIFQSLPQSRVGMIIKIDGVGYYADDFGFKQLRSFDEPKQERNQKQSEQKKKTPKKHRR